MLPAPAKALSMIVLGLGSFAAGMLPAWFSERARQKHPLFLSFLLCFGAGVLLSTSLVHMLPEAREKLPNYSELALCIGFFLVYLVDEIVHFFYGAQGEPHEQHNAADERTSLLQNDLHHSNSDVIIQEKCCGETENPRMCHVSHKPPCNKSSSGIIGLLCALFVHSVLEGLAIGLQESASQVLLLLAAVASHKFVVGFCLGAELCDSMAGRLCAHIVCVVIFSAGSVAGIGIGAGLDSLDSLQESTAVPIMQALAAGTLLYVTVSEVLPRERSRWHGKHRGAGPAQFLALIMGFTIMYIMNLYLDKD